MSTKRRAVTGQGEEALLSREAAGLARLSEASSRLWHTQDLRAGLEEMLAATIELLGADRGAVQLLDAGAGVLRIVAQRGFEADFLDFFREVAPGEHAACGRALRSGQRIVIEDIEADAPFAPLRPMARAAGYRAVQSTPLIGRDGTPLGMLSTHFREPHRPSEHELRLLDLYVRQAADFIERHRMEEALRESERVHASQAAVLESVRDPLWATDADFRVVYWNDAATATFGWAADEVQGRHTGELFRVLVPGSTRDDAVAQLLQTGDFRGEVVCHCKDGHTVYTEVSSRVVRGPDGEVVRVVNTARDISARRQMEAALRESGERYRGLFDAMQEGMALLEVIGDPAGDGFDLRYVEVNRHYEAVTGLARRDLTGRALRAVLPTAQPGWFTAVARQALATGATFSGPHLTVSGRWVQAHAYCPREGQVAVLLADVTAAREAEEALLAAERARAELAENLGGEIAHRVKNNLAMISGLMQMQLLQESDAHTTEALRDAIGRIRTFAALHEQMYASRTEEVDLLVTLQRIGRTIGDLFPSWDKVAVEVLGDSFRCHARAATNLSVIANELITNALKHGGPGPDGQRTIRVSLHCAADGVTLSVWNSGAPVPEGLDPSQSRAMGLRLVQDMVDRYGGCFQLGSSEGGTRAEVVVPGEAIRKEAEHR